MKHVDYESLTPPAGCRVPGYPVTRGQQAQADQPCVCSVCHVGRLSAKDYTAYHESVSEPKGRPPIFSSAKDPEPVQICSVCLSPWGPGFKRICSRKTKAEIMEELGRSSSDKTNEKVLASQFLMLKESRQKVVLLNSQLVDLIPSQQL